MYAINLNAPFPTLYRMTVSEHYSCRSQIPEGAGGFSSPERERICGAFRPGLLMFFGDRKEIQL